MAPSPSTSIVVRIDSDLRFAEEALGSVIGQQKTPTDSLEIVVVAARLTDDARGALKAMIDGLDHPRLRLLDAGDATGAAAWAQGVDACTGEVVALLEGHDRFHPERLFRIRQAAPTDGDWIALSALRFIDALGDDARDDAPLHLAHRRALLDASRFPSMGFALLRQNLAETAGNLVFTRTLLRAVGGLDGTDEDPAWALLLAALERVEPILLPDPLLERRDLGRPRPGAEADFRFDTDDEAAAAQRRRRLDQWLERIRDRTPANPLAPCPAHWPVYFDLFVNRADRSPAEGQTPSSAAWQPPAASPPPAWQSWSDLIDFDDTEGRDFAISSSSPSLVSASAAERSALALAQAVIQSRRSPHPEERDALARGLSEAYDARVHPGGPTRTTPPWPEVGQADEAAEDRDESELAGQPRRGLRSLAPLRLASRLRQHLYFRRMIRDSGLFDVRGYREQCRERGLFVIDPISHFLRGADSHHLDPHPLFHTRYYLQRNPDVRGQVNPLLHYLLAGDAEGRRPHWLFDPTWYRMKHADVDESKQNALIHFVHQGAAEGRRGHPRHDLVGALHRATLADGRGRWRRFIDEAARGAEGANLRIAAREALAESDRVHARGDRSIEDLRRMRRQAERLRRSPLFDADFHRHWFGPDLERGGDAARRFLEHAAIEGVGFVGLDRVHDELERLAVRFDDPHCPELALLHRATESRSPDTAKAASVTLYVSSQGNIFFQEMTELLAHGFERVGTQVSIRDESAAPPEAPLAPGEHRIVIAPHEFFLLGDGPKRLSRGFLETTSLWLAEQPGSEFFAMGIWFAQFARRVLDVNPLSALAWGALGFEARALPLGHITGFADYADALEIQAPHVRRALRPRARPPCATDAPLRDRPIDVSFNGVLTDRRERFFARHAPVFSELECALFMPSPATPVSVRLASSLSPHDATALSQRSKILLNVHRGDTDYFEWHRLVVRGLWQRALVVSETSMPVPWLRPGEHYIEAEGDELPERIEWLLRSKDGQAEAERVRTAGFEAFRARYPLEGLCAAFLDDDDAFGPGPVEPKRGGAR